ncbi:uncharacterized protein LOC126845637 isoform X3 [Adelges cooleyi]|uniref:uncharacterized protein LOC126845637 isoform X3 n=1 Tax=Adelges cooleyi TaxID=133065 RepID=UPI00217F8EE0|nr:uncharacterized protein LOC126845637 isoform X3 [Adelges cooleyi]
MYCKCILLVVLFVSIQFGDPANPMEILDTFFENNSENDVMPLISLKSFVQDNYSTTEYTEDVIQEIEDKFKDGVNKETFTRTISAIDKMEKLHTFFENNSKGGRMSFNSFKSFVQENYSTTEDKEEMVEKIKENFVYGINKGAFTSAISAVEKMEKWDTFFAKNSENGVIPIILLKSFVQENYSMTEYTKGVVQKIEDEFKDGMKKESFTLVIGTIDKMEKLDNFFENNNVYGVMSFKAFKLFVQENYGEGQDYRDIVEKNRDSYECGIIKDAFIWKISTVDENVQAPVDFEPFDLTYAQATRLDKPLPWQKEDN